MGRQSFGLMSGVLAIAVCAATAAFAADLPAPAPGPSYYPPSAPPPAHYNWSGIYFGGHVGAGLERDVVTFPTTTALPNPGVGSIAGGTTSNVNPSGVIGGAQAGANLQFGPAVVGVEGTWTSSAITGNSNAAAILGAGLEQSRSAPHWFATAVGKLGFAVNDWLFYAKGGGAWMRVDYTQTTLNFTGGTAGLGAGPQTITDNRNGWTAGAGIEYALNENLSAKLEYDFLNFGTKNYIFNGIAPPAGLPVSIQARTHMILLGMNYRFYFGGFGQY